MLYDLKPAFVMRLAWVEDRLVAARVGADALTALGVVASGLAAEAVIAGARVDPVAWLLVGPLGALRLAANALDGSIARRTRTTSSRGAVWNEVADRLGDLLLIGATAAVAPPALTAVAVAAAFATAWSALLAQALTGQRAAQGPMGKADRVALLGVTAAVATVTGEQAFAVGLWVLIAGAAVTVVRRLRTIA